LEVLGRLACDRTKPANLLPESSKKNSSACQCSCLEKTPQLVGVLVELPSRRQDLDSKCCRPLDLPGAKKEKEEIDIVYFNNENI
jgi:hypothetical protein